MKKVIRLTEGDLHKIIKESVNEILNDPYDYAKVKGLSAAAYKAAKTPGADPKWAERKMRQSALIKDRANKLANEYSDMEGNNSNVDWAMAGQNNHRVEQGLDDPKGYIKRNGYGDFLKGVKESKLNRIVKESVKKIIREGFEDDFNAARDNHIGRGGMFGLEMKNSEGDWQYGDVTYDPNTNTMSCMGVSIQVDPDMSIDQNLEGLYDELINNGYTDGDDEDDEWPEERINDWIDCQANYDDMPHIHDNQ